LELVVVVGAGRRRRSWSSSSELGGRGGLGLFVERGRSAQAMWLLKEEEGVFKLCD